MNYNVIVLILLILFCFCRKTVSVLQIAFTDNLSGSDFASTELPKQRFCGRSCNSMFVPWSGISPCRLRWVALLSPPAMTFKSSLLEWSWLLNIPPYWMFLWKILKYTTTLHSMKEVYHHDMFSSIWEATGMVTRCRKLYNSFPFCFLQQGLLDKPFGRLLKIYLFNKKSIISAV